MAKITTIEELREAVQNRDRFNWHNSDGAEIDHASFNEVSSLWSIVLGLWTAERKPWEPEPGKLIYVRLNHGFWGVRRFVRMQGEFFVTEHPDAPSPATDPVQLWPHAKPIDPTEVSK